MQGFSVESKTSGISSSSTLWQDLEAPYKSCNEVNITPRSPRTQPEKMENSEDLARKVLNLARQGASSNSERNWRQGHTCRRGGYRRLGKQHRAKEATNWAEVSPGWAAQAGRPRPFWGPVGPPFDLDASRAIYSPLTESHEKINSSSAAEEQRSLRDTISEMRVVLVV
jgi:hypothetical protein